MVSYKCLKCNNLFIQKIDYTRHINRINSCVKEEIKKNDISIHNTSHNSHKISHIEEINKGKYVCLYCNKEFVNKYNIDILNYIVKQKTTG